MTAGAQTLHSHRFSPRLAAGAAGLGATALITAVVLENAPLLALAAPAIVVSILACSRYPAAAVTATLFMCGTFGSLQAFFGLQVGPFLDLLLAGLWGGMVLGLAAGRAEQRWILPGLAALVIWVILTGFEIFTAESISSGLKAFRATAWYIAALVPIVYGAWPPRTYARMARGVVIVAALVGAYATFRSLVGPADSERTLALTASQAFGSYNTVGGELTTFGSFTSRHQLGFWVATMLPFCLAFCWSERRRWRLLGIAACLLSIAPLFATEVRAALLGTTAGVLVVIASLPFARAFPGIRLGSSIGSVALAALVGVLAFTFTVGGSSESADRYGAILSPGGDPAYEARIYKWDQAFREIDDHPFGQGLGVASFVEQRDADITIAAYGVDNAYLKIALEQGFLMMVLFMLAAGLLLSNLIGRALASPHPGLAARGIGAAATLAAALVMLVTGPYIEQAIGLALWLVVAVGVGPLVSPRSFRSADEEPTKPTDTPMVPPR